jgi:hypothetical protein
MDVDVSPSLASSPIRPPVPLLEFLLLTLYLGRLAALGPLAIDMYLPAFPRIADGFGAVQ